IVRFAVRPFDTQWCYYTGVRPVWNEPRPSLWEQVWDGNWFLLTRLRPGKDPEGVPVHFTKCLSDDHILSPDAVAIPAMLKRQSSEGLLFASNDTEPERNCSSKVHDYVCSVFSSAEEIIPNLWIHVLALAHSPAYSRENADALRHDWPRIPLPATKDALLKSV